MKPKNPNVFFKLGRLRRQNWIFLLTSFKRKFRFRQKLRIGLIFVKVAPKEALTEAHEKIYGRG